MTMSIESRLSYRSSAQVKSLGCRRAATLVGAGVVGAPIAHNTFVVHCRQMTDTHYHQMTDANDHQMADDSSHDVEAVSGALAAVAGCAVGCHVLAVRR